MSKNNGGAAFPLASAGGGTLNNGMDLRDYFAAKFAEAIHASTTYVVTMPDTGRHVFTQPVSQTAEQAYALADAMLKERAK